MSDRLQIGHIRDPIMHHSLQWKVVTVNSRVVARYMGGGIKGLQDDGISDHGLGIGISAVFHRIRDHTDS